MPHPVPHIGPICLAMGLLLHINTVAQAESLTIELGDAPIRQATARPVGGRNESAGVVADGKATFNDLQPGQRYDVTLTRTEGIQLRLLDCSWYNDIPPAAPTPGPLSDDDRAEITAIVKEIKAFTNKNEIVQLLGDADRAVAIVELTRDTDFHARAGDEIFWRIEVWYFENQAGGWAKVQQQNRVIERVRFKSREDYEKTRSSLRWIGIDKGLHIRRGEDAKVAFPSDGK